MWYLQLCTTQRCLRAGGAEISLSSESWHEATSTWTEGTCYNLHKGSRCADRGPGLFGIMSSLYSRVLRDLLPIDPAPSLVLTFFFSRVYPVNRGLHDNANGFGR